VNSELDVTAERRATPGCESVVHLNNAGAALNRAATVDRVVEHLHLEASIGGYEAADAVADELSAARATAARLIGAHPDEVAFTTSDTVAFSKALWGYALGGGVPVGSTVLADRSSYSSHYFGLWQVARQWGARLEVVAALEDGTIDLDDLEARLSAGLVAAVSVTQVGTHRGLVNPVAEAGRRCRDRGVPLLVDGAQSFGQLVVDVDDLGCDVFTTTGRKWLRGPRATGLLYARRAFAARCTPPGIDSSSATWTSASDVDPAIGPARFEEFELPIANLLGLGDALAHLERLGVDVVEAAVRSRADSLRSALSALASVTVHDGGTRQCGIVTFSVAGVAAPEVQHRLRDNGVNTSISRASQALLDFGALPGQIVRASPHYYNTEAELDRLVGVVAALAGTV
jgi:selenocysteine lyase/cysteine desulfurase